MTTPKTWEEVREIAAKAAWEQLSAGRTWESASVLEREERRIEADAALRALRAAGLAVVPREATEVMRQSCLDLEVSHAWSQKGEHIDADSVGDVWSTALSAGELAPPDKGEG